MASELAEFGIIGLGVMGQNLALNVEEHGYSVAVWNLETDWTTRFLAAHPGKRLVCATTLPQFVAALAPPRRILLMITAGRPVDHVLAELTPLLDANDVVIDGGNSFYKDTQRREAEVRAFRFIGMGVSGGEEGARRGPSLMPGGERAAYEVVRPVLEAIAARSEAGPCVTYVGPDGAGHFVKMVHNGIEYADMQIIAEAYELLRRGLGLEAAAISDIFAAWNRGPLASFLVELTAQVLRVRDPETGRPLVDLVRDAAQQKGTGKWTAQAALELGVVTPTIAAAIDARVLSSAKEERVRLSERYAGPPAQATGDPRAFVDDLQQALYAAKICAYAQGMSLLAAGSRAYGWHLSLGELARIWKAGCIIRAKFLDVIRRAYQLHPEEPNLLFDDAICADLQAAQGGWRRTVARAVERGLAVPALSASLAYFDSSRSAELPQNLTQAQRDAFGSHTYERLDHPERGAVHSPWLDEP